MARGFHLLECRKEKRGPESKRDVKAVPSRLTFFFSRSRLPFLVSEGAWFAQQGPTHKELFMTRQLAALIAAVVVQGSLASQATAGPITWSYSSQGGEIDGYFLTGQPMTTVHTMGGETTYLLPYSDFGPKIGEIEERLGLVSVTVTLTDDASNESAVIDVPYYFFSTEADAIDLELYEWRRESLRLGDNDYELTQAAGNQGLNVGVGPAAVQTPEPTSIVLACVGLAGAGAVRLRRRRAFSSGQQA